MEEFKKAENKNPTQIDIQSMINRMLLPIVIEEEKSMWKPDENAVVANVETGRVPIRSGQDRRWPLGRCRRRVSGYPGRPAARNFDAPGNGAWPKAERG
jgi:hypothetical protein